MLSRLFITFLPKSNHLLISRLQSSSAVILDPFKIKSVTISIVSPSICHEVMGPDTMILVTSYKTLQQSAMSTRVKARLFFSWLYHPMYYAFLNLLECIACNSVLWPPTPTSWKFLPIDVLMAWKSPHLLQLFFFSTNVTLPVTDFDHTT